MFSASVPVYFNYNERKGDVPSTNSSFTWTIPVGVANINTTVKQFGTGSMWGNTGGGYIQTTTTNTFMNCGAGDFTIEGWVYIPTARAANQTADIIVNNVTNGLGIRMGNIYNSSNVQAINHLMIFRRGSADLDYAYISWPRDKWNHWVVQRSTINSIKEIAFWVNGTKLTRLNGTNGTGNTYNFANSASSTQMTIGNYNSGGLTDENLRGIYLDEICSTIGTYRYDPGGNIVVPIEPFIVDAQTRLLMHMDGTSGSTTFTNATS